MKYNDISKIQAAESQLKTAIELFFKEDIASMRIKMLDSVPEGKRKNLHDHLWYHKNFFKHSGKENISVKMKFNPEYTELILWDAVRLFYSITKQKIPTLLIYDLWTYSKYPSLYKLSSEEKRAYDSALGTATYRNKNHFWNLVHEAEKELKKNVSPHTQVLFFDNKNFKKVETEFDPNTKVWSAYYTLNEQSPVDPEEEFILNFYLNNVWTANITAEGVARTFLNANLNIIGSPFVAPDNLTRKPAYIVVFTTKKENHSYLNITKVSSLLDGVFAVTYSKKILGDNEEVSNHANHFLVKNAKSEVGTTLALADINLDESWIAYLKEYSTENK